MLDVCVHVHGCMHMHEVSVTLLSEALFFSWCVPEMLELCFLSGGISEVVFEVYCACVRVRVFNLVL